jgi:adenine-specific DNA-methyltransferase
MLKFAELEVMAGTTCLHAAATLAETGERVVVSFGPEHGALEQRQVEHAMREAGDLFPRPKMIVFCAFTFDPEAAKDIDATQGHHRAEGADEHRPADRGPEEGPQPATRASG